MVDENVELFIILSTGDIKLSHSIITLITLVQVARMHSYEYNN